MRSIICLIHGHVPGNPVSVRGYSSALCTRCGRPIELTASDALRRDVVAGLTDSLDDPARVPARTRRFAERVR